MVARMASPMDQRGSVTFAFPSRFFPAVAIIFFLCTISFCVSCVILFDHDVGGIYWPYLSDTGHPLRLRLRLFFVWISDHECTGVQLCGTSV